MKQRRPLFCGRRQGLARRGGFLSVVSWFPDNTPGPWFAHNTPASERSVLPEPTIRPPSSRIFRHRRRRHLSAGSLQSPIPCVRTLVLADPCPADKKDAIPQMTTTNSRRG